MIKGLGLWAVLGMGLLAGCAGKPGASSVTDASCDGIRGFFQSDLEAYRSVVDEAGKAYQEEQWKVDTAAPGASSERRSALFEALQKVAYDQSVLKKTRALDDATKTVTAKECPLKEKLSRARGMLEASILTDAAVIQKEKTNQDLEDALQKKSNAFRIAIPDETEPLSEALFKKKLSATPDRKQREELYGKYNALRSAKWVEWGFRDLIKARNQEARLAGFENYYEYRYFRGQLDLKNYREMVAELKAKLAPKLRTIVAQWGKREGLSKVEGWDLAYLREKASAGEINTLLKTLPERSVIEIANRFYRGLGIDIAGYGFTMDLYPREGKHTHAYAVDVVLPRVDAQGNLLKVPKPDIRFLANLKKPVHWDDVSTVIHELAHAVNFAEMRQPLSIFRETDSTQTEAVAMLAERMAESKEFLTDTLPGFTKVTAPKLKPILERQLKGIRTEKAVVLLRQTFFSDFEYEVYRNPDANFSELWSKMHQEYWGVALDPARADWDIDHFVMAPAYVQNYTLGILMVEQMYESLLAEFKTSYKSKALGDKLRKVYFAPGNEFNYLTMVQRFTGKPLSAAAALRLVD